MTSSHTPPSTWSRGNTRSARRFSRFFIAAVIGAMVIVGAAGAGALDQSSTAGNERSNYLGASIWEVAQTFTAGATGWLDQVDLYMNQWPSTADGPVKVEIQSAAGDLPTGTVLATTTILASDVFLSTINPTTADWATATFSVPASVSAGTQYAIVLTSTATTALLQTFEDPAGGYPGGRLLRRENGTTNAWAPRGTADLNFRTYVAPAVALARGGYCSSKPVLRVDGTVGIFLDLVADQPTADPTYAGAVRAFFGERYGLTCDMLTGKGYKDAGYKVDGSGVRTGNPAADVYQYFLKP